MAPRLIKTNFHDKEMAHWRWVGNGLFALTGLFIFISLVLIILAHSQATQNERSIGQIDAMRQGLQALQPELKKAAAHRGSLGRIEELLKGIKLPVTKSAAAMLYELELRLPENVILTAYSQDVREGRTEFTAQVNDRSVVPKIVEQLQGVKGFSSVRLVNQRQLPKGNTEVAIVIREGTD